MGLSSASHTLLAAILKEQKGETISYQVVNNLDNNQPVDKVITQFEDFYLLNLILNLIENTKKQYLKLKIRRIKEKLLTKKLEN